MMREAAEILGARWDKVPERHRPHYSPEQRFRILRIRSLLGLSQRETAVMFRVSTETIARWEVETAIPDGEAPRPLVAPSPPVRRFADVVRAVVKTMELAGFGGSDLIARTLARAGWKLSPRTVGRIRKGRWPVPRVPEAASTIPRAVRAKRPNHIWMVDLTDVKGLFGIVTFKVAVVFDAFSRMPLSARVFTKEPSSPEIARFVSRAAGRRPDGITVPCRLPRRRTTAASSGSKSSLMGGHPGEHGGRRVRALRHRGGRGSGLCAPTGTTIPIAPLHSAAVLAVHDGSWLVSSW